MGNVILYDLGHEIWLEVYIKLNICVRASVDTPSDRSHAMEKRLCPLKNKSRGSEQLPCISFYLLLLKYYHESKVGNYRIKECPNGDKDTSTARSGLELGDK